MEIVKQKSPDIITSIDKFINHQNYLINNIEKTKIEVLEFYNKHKEFLDFLCLLNADIIYTSLPDIVLRFANAPWSLSLKTYLEKNDPAYGLSTTNITSQDVCFIIDCVKQYKSYINDYAMTSSQAVSVIKQGKVQK